MRSSIWRALGNTYVLVEPSGVRLDASRARDLAKSADGVLEILGVDGASVACLVWNPDGTLAELSGNGTRIVATWYFERADRGDVRIAVGSREVKARLLADGSIEQDLGPVEVARPEDVAGVRVIPVSVGNPHAVVLDDPDEVTRLGPLLETHPRFPERTNVQVARVEAPGLVTARVWERGVGETPSSGTSAAAVAAATHGPSATVVVRFPGGDLCVRLEGGRALLVAPPAERLS